MDIGDNGTKLGTLYRFVDGLILVINKCNVCTNTMMFVTIKMDAILYGWYDEVSFLKMEYFICIFYKFIYFA